MGYGGNKGAFPKGSAGSYGSSWSGHGSNGSAYGGSWCGNGWYRHDDRGNGSHFGGGKFGGGKGGSEVRHVKILPPRPFSQSREEKLKGETQSFARGHSLGAAGELYFEVSGECNVQLLIHGSTRVSAADHEDFQVGPVTLASQRFQTVQALQFRIRKIREIYETNLKDGKSGRLAPDDERLMWEVFRHHPEAERKLSGATFIQVGQAPKADSLNAYTFLVMRNEQDGDSISYVSCLRRLVDVARGESAAESMLSLASLSLDPSGLKVEMGGHAMLLDHESVTQNTTVGIRVELEKKQFSLHRTSQSFGPYSLNRELSATDTTNTNLVVLVDAPGEATICWASPWKCHPQRLRLPGKRPPESAPVAKEPANLKRSLELLMKEAQVPGDLSGFPLEEVKRIAYQSLVRSLHTATQIQRSRKAAEAQGQSLVILAKNQSQEMMEEQLKLTLQELRTSNAQQEALQAVNEKLSEELATLRRQVQPKVTDGPGAIEDSSRESTAVEDSGGHSMDADPRKKLQDLNLRLRTQLPDHAVRMLQGSLKLVSSEMYSGPVRAFWELLQNADDCRYKESPAMKVAYSSKYLWLEYNEVGFSFEDVEALCSLCASTKGVGQTGHKGVGFKASFVLSGKPHVLSETYKFFFDEENDCALPQVTPEALPSAVSLPREPPSKGTAIYLPLRKAFSVDLLGELHPSTLLFLRRLKSITVENERGGPCQSYTYELGRSRDDERIDTVVCTKTKVEDGEDLPMKEEEEHNFFVARLPDKPEVAIAFPLTGLAPPCAAVSATLPLTTLPGLKTPLNAPFQLTANREALQDGSPENAELRDHLAELWLKTVKEAKQVGLPMLQMRAWLLLPGSELAQQRFWAPFYQKVSCGLREVPLVPVRGSAELLPMSRCRKPDSHLLASLDLGPKQLEQLGLGIPTEEYIAQLPEGSSPSFSEFDAKDLMKLLEIGGWEVRGNLWRKSVVKALAKHPHQLDLIQLSKVPIFILADPDAATQSIAWSKCGEGQIYSSVPKTAPNGLLKALDTAHSCKEDKELLKILGCGGRATHRDVGYAIVSQVIGLTVADDERFSWSNLAYIGRHWDSILESSAADAKLSKLTREEMEDLLKGILVPECTAGVLHVPCELYTPFILGCKAGTNIERHKLAREPPSASGVQQRLWWERVFLRLGVQPLCLGSGFATTVRLPKGLFAVPKVCNEISALLEHYEKLGALEALRQCCEITDCAGEVRNVAHGGNPRRKLLGPAFQAYVGPNYVVEVCKAAAKQELAERLLGVVMEPTADLILLFLDRAADQGSKTWLTSCKFLAEEWLKERLSPQQLAEVKAKGQLWLPAADGKEGGAIVKSIAKTCWPEIEAFIPPWGMRKSQRDNLKNFLVSGLGIAEEPPSNPPATPEMRGMVGMASPDPGMEGAGPEDIFKVKEEVEDRDTSVACGGVVLSSRRGSASAKPTLAPAVNGSAAGHSGGTKRPIDASSPVDLRPSKVKREEDGARGAPSVPLPQLRDQASDGNLFDHGPDVAAVNSGLWHHALPLSTVAKLLMEIYHQNDGEKLLHGQAAGDYRDMAVSKIRFSQNSVAATFAHGALKGRSLLDVAADLEQGKLSTSDLPLSVVKHGEEHFTLNNRSLYVLAKVSSRREPLVARVMTFQLCPATAKFLQLRYSSLAEAEPDDAEESEGEGAEGDAEKEPEFDVKEEEMLEQGTAGVA